MFTSSFASMSVYYRISCSFSITNLYHLSTIYLLYIIKYKYIQLI